MSYSGHPDQYFGCTTYSQHGEDLMLLNLFGQLHIEKPSYLDLGAHHPVNISNTKLLYHKMGKGVNVEANVNLMINFVWQRPEDINVLAAIGVSPGVSKFYMFDNESGLNTCSKEEADKVSAESGMSIEKIIDVQTYTLNEIVDKYCDGIFPQFLNCDIEGLDFHILKLADFSKSAPIIICVETRISDSEKMSDMMREKGFLPYCRMGENILYIRYPYILVLFKNMGSHLSPYLET